MATSSTQVATINATAYRSIGSRVTCGRSGTNGRGTGRRRRPDAERVLERASVGASPTRPLPTAGGPTGSASSASVWLYGRRPSSVARPRSRDPRNRPLAPSGLGAIAAPRLVTLATRISALGRSPCVSERASFEVPGCGHASCCSACGSVPASARSLARRGGSFASHRARLRCLGPKTVGGPRCRPLATARSWRVTFHPYKGMERRRTVAAGTGEKSRSLVKGWSRVWAAFAGDMWRGRGLRAPKGNPRMRCKE